MPITIPSYWQKLLQEQQSGGDETYATHRRCVLGVARGEERLRARDIKVGARQLQRMSRYPLVAHGQASRAAHAPAQVLQRPALRSAAPVRAPL